MKPVMQTGDNCWEACVASILEVPLESVFLTTKDGSEADNWLQVFRSWLILTHNCTMIDIKCTDIKLVPSGAYCIISGQEPGERGPHAIVGHCVGETIKCIHDPTGDEGYRIGPPCQWVVTFIFKLDTKDIK